MIIEVLIVRGDRQEIGVMSPDTSLFDLDRYAFESASDIELLSYHCHDSPEYYQQLETF